VEQDRFLSSVIRVLVQATSTTTATNDDVVVVPLYTQSSALARAYAMRAQAKLDQGLLDDALQDARAALEITCPTTTTTTTSTTTTSPASASRQWITTRVYRTLVDAYQAQGQIQKALDCLQQWLVVDPTFSTKILQEMTRLRQFL
jgi:tetratricopeptide (TPR) repeat protein